MNEIGSICALGSSVTWALGSSGYSRMSRNHSPFAVNFSRALIALPLFLLAVIVSEGGLAGAISVASQIQWQHLGWFSLSMLASYGVGDVLFLWSTREIGVPGALAVASSYPILTALFGYLFQGQRLSYVQVGGLLLTVIGVVTVILSAATPLEVGEAQKRSTRKGVLLALVTACLWSLNSYAVAQGGQGISAALGNTVRMILAMGMSFGLGRLMMPNAPAFMPAGQLARWSWLFALEAFGGSYLFLYGLSHSPLAVGAALASLAPVISVPVAWAMRIERFSAMRTVAVCIVVAGIWMLLTGT